MHYHQLARQLVPGQKLVGDTLLTGGYKISAERQQA